MISAWRSKGGNLHTARLLRMAWQNDVVRVGDAELGRAEVAVWAEARSIFNVLRKSETPQAPSPFCFCFFFLPLLTSVQWIWLSESACHFRYFPRSSQAIISYHAVALPACSLSLEAAVLSWSEYKCSTPPS